MVSFLSLTLLSTTHLMMLLVHLHDLHDWLLHLHLATSLILLPGLVVWNSERGFFGGTLLLLELIVVESRYVVVHVCQLHLIVFFSVR
jgi:hypothetical protein